MLNKLFGRMKRKALPRDLSYEEARDVLERADHGARDTLASREDAPPETLYYLASDKDVRVRRDVAANPSTPPQANLLLADDVDEEVRVELAGKIRRLLPHLSEDEVAKTRDLTFAVINKLAEDQLPRVRQIVAEEIKHAHEVPRELVLKLAKDSQLVVAAPILEYSPLLTDTDLLELVAVAHIEGAVDAVARRENLAEDVSQAVVASLEIPAIAALLANSSARIREETMDQVVEQARTYAELEEPVVLRKDLSVRIMRRLAEFVVNSLLDILNEQGGLDDEIAATVRRRSRKRIKQGELEDTENKGLHADAAARVAKAAKAGTLDDEKMSDAADAGDRIFLLEALAHLAGVPVASIEKVFDAKSPKGIAAVTWKAKLSMRVAYKIQQGIFKLPANKLLLARQGIHYPLTEEELKWHLDYFGVPTT